MNTNRSDKELAADWINSAIAWLEAARPNPFAAPPEYADRLTRRAIRAVQRARFYTERNRND